MKRNLLVFSVLLMGATAFGQKYEDIKNMMMLPGQLSKAKDLLDKNSADAKFFNKPEGNILKATLLSMLALDSAKVADADKNRNEGYTAFTAFKTQDPSMKLLDDAFYRNAPYNLYASYFNSGVADINAKNYDPAFEKFVKVVDLSDLLIAKKINLKGPVDTNALYYAGILGETTKHFDDATKYNTRLADLKVTGANYESVYQGLVRYYAGKNDQANFEKYKALGKSLYPNSEFFTYNMVDFAVGSGSNFNERVANLEKMIAGSPEDYKANIALAEVIYDTLDSRKEGAVKPGNAAELEGKMLKALEKASTLKPQELQPWLLLGDHFATAASALGDAMRPIETEIDKKGAKATAADKQKLADAKKKYEAAYDKSGEYYQKAADIFAQKGTLEKDPKRQYKIIAGNLSEYYSYKKDNSKGTDVAKYTALQKKYDDLFEQLRKP